jgi:hypothetical protein
MVSKKKVTPESLKTSKTSPSSITSLVDLVNKSRSLNEKNCGLNGGFVEDDCGFKFQRKQSSPTTVKPIQVEPVVNHSQETDSIKAKNEKRRRRKSLIAGNANVSTSGRKSSISINLSQGT